MNQSSFAHVVRAIHLSTDFHFFMAILSPPDTASTLADAIGKEIGAARVVRLDPGTGFTVEHAEDAIIRPLTSPTAEAASTGTVTIVDATGAPYEKPPSDRALTGDNAAWLRTFGRMDAFKSDIGRALGGALILAMRPHMEGIFVRNAPSLWSVRSGAFVL